MQDLGPREKARHPESTAYRTTQPTEIPADLANAREMRHQPWAEAEASVGRCTYVKIRSLVGVIM